MRWNGLESTTIASLDPKDSTRPTSVWTRLEASPPIWAAWRLQEPIIKNQEWSLHFTSHKISRRGRSRLLLPHQTISALRESRCSQERTIWTKFKLLKGLDFSDRPTKWKDLSLKQRQSIQVSIKGIKSTWSNSMKKTSKLKGSEKMRKLVRPKSWTILKSI